MTRKGMCLSLPLPVGDLNQARADVDALWNLPGLDQKAASTKGNHPRCLA
jgi:hypothetical protein